ncbi:hypothetical protein DFH09DRAFT_1178627 [Mycena vulgaris]|nr:hypothetical protein DFH09DRAFT_1178627 [Mycena vulgaris]
MFQRAHAQVLTRMYSTRSNSTPSSPESARPRKKHVHAECGEPIKGHHRVNGALVCRSTDVSQSVVKSKMATERSGVQVPALSQLQPGTLDDLESAMAHSLELLREAKAHGFSSRGMPGTLHGTSGLQRRGVSSNPSWAEVAIAALDTFRELWKHTFGIVVLLICLAVFLARNDSPKPSLTCKSS